MHRISNTSDIKPNWGALAPDDEPSDPSITLSVEATTSGATYVFRAFGGSFNVAFESKEGAFDDVFSPTSDTPTVLVTAGQTVNVPPGIGNVGIDDTILPSEPGQSYTVRFQATSAGTVVTGEHAYTVPIVFEPFQNREDLDGAIEDYFDSPETAVVTYGDIATWKFSINVTDFSSLFDQRDMSNIDISGWDVSSVTNMSGMFKDTVNWGSMTNNIGGWNVSKVTDMRLMFKGCTSFRQSLKDWDVSSVSSTGFSAMFEGTGFWPQDNYSTTNGDSYMLYTWSPGWYSKNTNWSPTVANMEVFFYKRVTNGLNDTSLDKAIEEYWTTTGKAIGKYGDIKTWKFANSNLQGSMTGNTYLTDMSKLFEGRDWATPVAPGIGGIDISDWDVSSVTDMSEMFKDTVNWNYMLNHIGDWDTQNVTNMRSMFENCTTFNQGIITSGTYWNVSSVTDMRKMLKGCWSFDRDISGWTVSSVQDMSLMFHNCVSFDQDIGSWNVTSVTDMSEMFVGCTSFRQNSIKNWDVTGVTVLGFEAMFRGSGDWDISDVSVIDVEWRANIYWSVSTAEMMTGAAPVRVVLIGGQSNAVGYADSDRNLDGDMESATGSGTDFTHWARNGQGEWPELADVYVYNHKSNTGTEDFPVEADPQTGNLTIGFGQCVQRYQVPPNQRSGIELEIGKILGDDGSGPVLILKAAFGGKDLRDDFKPPSLWADGYTPSFGDDGFYYAEMIRGWRAGLDSYVSYFPALAGRTYEINSFVWFQGYSDALKYDPEDYYANHLHTLITDVRNEFGTEMRAVIGETGNFVDQPNQAIISATQQQAADNTSDTYYVSTAQFLTVSGPQPSYRLHWYHNANAYLKIGRALGQMIVNPPLSSLWAFNYFWGVGTENWFNGYLGTAFTAAQNLTVTAFGRLPMQRFGELLDNVTVSLWQVEVQNEGADDEYETLVGTGPLREMTVGPGAYLVGTNRYENLLDPIQLVQGNKYVITQLCSIGMSDKWIPSGGVEGIGTWAVNSNICVDNVERRYCNTDPGSFPGTPGTRRANTVYPGAGFLAEPT